MAVARPEVIQMTSRWLQAHLHLEVAEGSNNGALVATGASAPGGRGWANKLTIRWLQGRLSLEVTAGPMQ